MRRTSHQQRLLRLASAGYPSVRATRWSFALPCLIVTACAAISQAGTHGDPAERQEQKLNVLFLVSDDLRPELGCYGNDVIKSPNIDRLATKGTTFLNAYCQQAVCSPSRTSVMTGTRPDTNRVWDLTTHFREALPDVVTLPQLFKQHGYACKSLGKIYHGTELDDPPSWSTTEIAQKAGDGSVPLDRGTIRRRKANRKRGPAFRVSDAPPNGGGDGRLADEAIATLRKFGADPKPFFLAVGFRKPHLPFVVPKAYWARYDANAIPLATNRFLPQNAPAYALADRNELWKYRDVPDMSHFSDDYARQLKHGYYAAVSYMDAQLGRVVEELDRLGLTESTLILLWGDHGWKLGEHDRWCKHSTVEDDTRSPLIIVAPGTSQAGRSTQRLVELVDICPTLVELVGLPAPAHLEGSSLAALLRDPDRAWKSAAFSQYPRTVGGKRLMGYSMRTERYRFTRWVDRNDPQRVDAIELYDHMVDPEENTNVAHDATNQDLVVKLTRQWFAGWQGSTPSTAIP